MRIFNLIGSVVFVVYGVLIPAISTAVLNFVLIVINTYHIAMLVIDKKNEEKVERKLKNVKDYLKINPSSDDEDKNIDVDFTFYDKDDEELFDLTYNKFRVDNLNFNYSLNGNNELILTIEKRLMTKNDKAQNKDLDGLIYHMVNIYRNNCIDDFKLNISLYAHE